MGHRGLRAGRRRHWFARTVSLRGVPIGGVGKTLSTLVHPLHVDAGFSTSGWLAVILTFVLARFFAVGSPMRNDLDGTV